MERLKLVLFESPVWLGGLSFLMFSVVLLYRKHMAGRAAARSLSLVLIVIGGLFTVQALVTTEREKILRALGEFVEAVERADGPDIASCVSTEYDSEGLDRDAFVALLVSKLNVLRVYDTRIRRSDVHISGDRAAMTLVAHATVSERGMAGDRHWGRWNIGWLQKEDRWKVASVRPEVLDAIPFTSLRNLPNVLR